MPAQRLPHIVLPNSPESLKFTPIGGGGSDEKSLHPRERLPHGLYLQNRLEAAWQLATQEQQAVAHNVRNGVYLEFASDPDFNLAIQSLEDLRKNIRLINVREKSIPVANEDQEQTYQVTTLATVYVPVSYTHLDVYKRQGETPAP